MLFLFTPYATKQVQLISGVVQKLRENDNNKLLCNKYMKQNDTSN